MNVGAFHWYTPLFVCVRIWFVSSLIFVCFFFFLIIFAFLFFHSFHHQQKLTKYMHACQANHEIMPINATIHQHSSRSSFYIHFFLLIHWRFYSIFNPIQSRTNETTYW